jgi:hypothetical protein
LNRDKRNAVMALLADEEWSQKGSGRLAASLNLTGNQVFIARTRGLKFNPMTRVRAKVMHPVSCD